MPDRSLADDVLARTAPLYDRVRRVIPPLEWPVFAADVDAILALKRERNAVILAHNYQTPEIFHGVADIVGDSLALAREAAQADADVIVLAGVHFMAETAKLLNPGKTVLIPDRAPAARSPTRSPPPTCGCCAQRYPGVPVVTYVNTSAAVKAETDICCTSGNARKVVESLGAPRVIMLPDEYLAQNVAAETGVEIIAWPGHCEVHERFTAAEIRTLRADASGLVVLAHPECPPEVVAEADFAGSTAAMVDYVGTAKPARVVLVTECSMSDNVAVRASRDRVRAAVQSLPAHEADHARQDPPGAGDDEHEVTIDPAVAAPRAPRGRAHADAVSAVALLEEKAPVMTVPPLPAVMTEPLVRAALLEDLGRAGDITTDAIVPMTATAETALVARQAGDRRRARSRADGVPAHRSRHRRRGRAPRRQPHRARATSSP